MYHGGASVCVLHMSYDDYALHVQYHRLYTVTWFKRTEGFAMMWRGVMIWALLLVALEMNARIARMEAITLTDITEYCCITHT